VVVRQRETQTAGIPGKLTAFGLRRSARASPLWVGAADVCQCHPTPGSPPCRERMTAAGVVVSRSKRRWLAAVPKRPRFAALGGTRRLCVNAIPLPGSPPCRERMTAAGVVVSRSKRRWLAAVPKRPRFAALGGRGGCVSMPSHSPECAAPGEDDRGERSYWPIQSGDGSPQSKAAMARRSPKVPQSQSGLRIGEPAA
jgi:hypothetical protein